MISWDKKYLKMVRNAGIMMRLYMRYIDDSNQVAETPPAGSRYDKVTGKIVHDEDELQGRLDEKDDARTARILREIANCVMEGIEMEGDYPSNNQSGKLPILDMRVWINQEGYLLYEHYEKPMSSKRVMHSQSAQSGTCKKSVHVQEILRRMLNMSSRLNWKECGAPVVSEYMARMKDAGYNEQFRRSTLLHAVRILDKMKEEENEGKRPVFRPKNWQKEQRKIDKRKKKHSWSTKGGYTAAIMVPSTPGSELANMLRGVAEQEAQEGIQFRIVESGGRTVKSDVQRSNPTATPGCTDSDCLPCKEERGGGGQCRKTNIQYSMDCRLCPESDPTTYIGETSRNLYTRAKEHVDKCETRKEDSFMWTHQEEKHNGAEADFKASVTHSFRDCLSRQVSEAVYIRRSEKPVLNSKSEWHQPALFRVQSEILRG